VRPVVATKKGDQPAGNIVKYKDRDGRVHYASRTAPNVVKGLESGEFTLLEEVVPDAPTVSKQGDAANTRTAGNGS
jgi:hypothetical protein